MPYTFLYKLLGKFRLLMRGNFGYTKDTPEALGADNGESHAWEVLQKDGQWDVYLPKIEYQRFAWGETMACVTFSFFNAVEAVAKRRYNENRDFTDRFTAKYSGTTTQGNSMYNVFQSAAVKDGTLSLGNNNAVSWSQFYEDWSKKYLDIAQATKKEQSFYMKWVSPTSPENLKEALTYSPLWVAIYAYGKKVDGVYQKITGHRPNHCVCIYGYDDDGNWKVYDHYLGGEHRLLAPDYIIGAAANVDFIKK